MYIMILWKGKAFYIGPFNSRAEALATANELALEGRAVWFDSGKWQDGDIVLHSVTPKSRRQTSENTFSSFAELVAALDASPKDYQSTEKRRSGRPRLSQSEETVLISVSMPASLAEKAETLGNGNRSAGIRLALERFGVG